MPQFTEQNWRDFLGEYKAENFPGVPTTDEDYFTNSRALLHEDLTQLEVEGPITFRFYPPEDKSALITYGKDRKVPKYYKMRFAAYDYYAKQQGKKIKMDESWVGETLHVKVSIR